MKSTEFLQSAMDVQKERGEQYDKPSGERSMGATVRAFNAITGHTLEESDGWMLMGLLKLVRQSQNPEKYHHDSALDYVAYASLYAEAASEQCGQVDCKSSTSIWDTLPSNAKWIAVDEDGELYWYENEPRIDEEHTHNLYWYAEGDYDLIKCTEIPEDARLTLVSRPQ